MADLTPSTPGSLSIDHLEHTLGVFFVGYMFSMVLYGFTFFQSYMYHSRYPNDLWVLKLVVALLCCFDTAVSVLLSQTLYHYMVELFPYTRGSELATDPFCAQLALAFIAVFVAQLFYAYSVWSTTKNALVSGVIAMFSTVGFVLGMIMSARLFQDPDFSHLAANPSKAIAAVSHSAIAISGLLSFGFLSLNPQPSVFKPLSSPFETFVSYTFSRGGAAFVMQFCLIFVFVGLPGTLYWIPFHVVATKLFVIGAITLLNSRTSSQAGSTRDDHWGSSQATRTIGGSSAGNGAMSGLEFNHKRPIVIEVAQSTQQDMDKIDYDVHTQSRFDAKTDYNR
ncbi:hypothetical protein Hypma_005052 [Hypsizygus marmoreus]|uniref:Uncharacterized protein n=1 Tax=Hypsizygus marmoreus TaxID=39966 RepID=A0A369K5D0_HYPMA|nr:hypothetical protein Hypma_005052 [Hypsizygus marmoreus]